MRVLEKEVIFYENMGCKVEVIDTGDRYRIKIDLNPIKKKLDKKKEKLMKKNDGDKDA